MHTHVYYLKIRTHTHTTLTHNHTKIAKGKISFRKCPHWRQIFWYKNLNKNLSHLRNNLMFSFIRCLPLSKITFFNIVCVQQHQQQQHTGAVDLLFFFSSSNSSNVTSHSFNIDHWSQCRQHQDIFFYNIDSIRRIWAHETASYTCSILKDTINLNHGYFVLNQTQIWIWDRTDSLRV